MRALVSSHVMRHSTHRVRFDVSSPWPASSCNLHIHAQLIIGRAHIQALVHTGKDVQLLEDLTLRIALLIQGLHCVCAFLGP